GEMFSNSNTLPKLYLSVIDDVMENVRELFLEEGIEEQVLDDLRQNNHFFIIWAVLKEKMNGN
uniref:Uncharacterized protein n=1 Tax=Astyanax mexicanus TaxID=7994 RepID=W5LLM1_ASTMX